MWSDCYTPAADATLDQILDKARACGRDLRPTSNKAEWIDDLVDPAVRQAAINAYHEGQSEQYEQADF